MAALCITKMLMIMLTVVVPYAISLEAKQQYRKHSKQINNDHKTWVKSCKRGWYGPTCKKPCNKECILSLCHQYNGQCILGCYELLQPRVCYGTMMNIKKRSSDDLNTNCLQRDPANEQLCTCCKPQFRGDSCDIFCKNCKTYDRGICRHFCEGGYYGDFCNKTCPETCATGHRKKPLCSENESGKLQCSNGCMHGYYGHDCGSMCRKSCNNSICFRENGTCVECPDRYHGVNCDIMCSNRCSQSKCYRNGTCYITCPVHCGNGDDSLCTGNEHNNTQCLFGCKEGYYALTCDKICKPSCKICDQESGKCFKCKDSLYGVRCDRNCSNRCSGGLCYINGTCVQCVHGFYGEFCRHECDSNCLFSNCIADTAEENSYLCVNGCRDGFRGPQCDEPPPQQYDASVAVTVPLICLLVVIFVVIIYLWKRGTIPGKCRCCRRGRKYVLRRLSSRGEEAIDEEREYLRRHPEFQTSDDMERVKSFRRYQQYYREIEARHSKLNADSDSPIRPPIVKTKYRSWPDLMLQKEVISCQDDHNPTKSAKQAVTSLFRSCSRLDKCRCTENTDVISVERNNEDNANQTEIKSTRTEEDNNEVS